MSKKYNCEFDDFNFPDEPKKYPQWVVCWADKIPLFSPGYGQPLVKASPVDPSTWMSFETAVHLCEMNEGLLPGFVLTATDPFTVIDLDVKEDTPREHVEWYEKLKIGANSYAEISSSGSGYHIWVFGNCGEGRRSSAYGIERYSQERFIICTGNDASGLEISDGNGILGYLEPLLTETSKHLPLVADSEQVKSDEEVIAEILDWENAEHFQNLYFLPVHEICSIHGHPSGSECDAALINFLVKASPNNAQVMRLFRASMLANRGPKPGQKDKIMADDKYLLRTINNYRSILEAEQRQKAAQSEALIAMSMRNLQAMAQNVKEKEGTLRQHLAVENAVYQQEKAEYTFPHGVIGEIAKWIYLNSTYSVEPISIVTALAACSGLTGKGWLFRNKFLSAYYIIAAPSGSGKNVIHTAIGQLASMLNDRSLDGHSIFNTSHMRSEAAWRKELLEKESYLQIYAEIGDLFDKVNAVNSDPSLLKFILEAYSYAHFGSRPGGMFYSNKEENVEAKNTEFTMSILGECVIADILKSLTGKLAEKGFISRFNFTIFDKDLPPRNMNVLNRAYAAQMPDWVFDRICKVASMAGSLKQQRNYIQVRCDTKETEDYLNQLEVQYREKSNVVRHDETLNQIWNRCTERIERMCGTFAVMNDPENPVVTMQDVEWCRNIVMSNVNYLLQRHSEGQIGEVTDDKVRKSVAKAIVDYFASDLSNHSLDYKYESLRQIGVLILSPVMRRCQKQLKRLESSNIREKPTKALHRVLGDFVAEGLIAPVNDIDKKTLREQKQITIARNANAWMVLDLEALTSIYSNK